LFLVVDRLDFVGEVSRNIAKSRFEERDDVAPSRLAGCPLSGLASGLASGFSSGLAGLLGQQVPVFSITSSSINGDSSITFLPPKTVGSPT